MTTAFCDGVDDEDGQNARTFRCTLQYAVAPMG